MEERTRTEQNGLITEELRDWMGASTHNTIGTELIMGSYNKLLAIADRIDEQHAKVRDKAYDVGVCDGIDADKNAMGYIKLPVDADGVPIHIGDYVETLIEAFKGERGRVECLTLTEDGWCVDGDAPSTVRHYHEPTVEDVLREFAEKMNENMGMYTGEAIDADEWRDADRQTIAEYAAKLRLAEEAE